MVQLRKENKYDFRKRLLTVHETDIRNLNRTKKENEYELQDNICICIPENAGEVLKTAAVDFADYLKVSINIKAGVGYVIDSELAKYRRALEL